MSTNYLQDQSTMFIPATLVTYKHLAIPSAEELTGKKLNEIILNIQGEAVEIMDTREITAAMKIFHYIYNLSPECVYRTLKNHRYMVFTHQSVPVIRDKEIIDYWIDAKNVSNMIIPSLEIDVEDLWNCTNGTELDRTKDFLSLVQKLSRAKIVTLVGSAPTLVFLFTQEHFSGSCRSLYYQKKQKGKKVKIY